MSQATGIEMMKRPGYSTVGRPTTIRTNFFEVTSLPTRNIYQYDISFVPVAPPIYNKMFTSYQEKIPFSDDGVVKEKSRTFQVIVIEKEEISLQGLRNLLNGASVKPDCYRPALHALDVLIKHKPSVSNFSVGGSFYTSSDSCELEGGLEAWQGYFQSCRATSGMLLVNIDTSCTAFYQEGALLNLVSHILFKRIDELKFGLVNSDVQKIARMIQGIKITINHRPGHKRKYRIARLTEKCATDTIFERDGKNISISEYFKEVYNMKLNFPGLPCVVVEKGIVFPVEVCQVIASQRYMKKLNDKQVAQMIKFTCHKPNVRANKINQGVRTLNFKENEYFKEFGLSVSDRMMEVNARIIEPPTLLFHPSSRERMHKPSLGAWGAKDKKFVDGAALRSWAVVSFCDEKSLRKNQLELFVKELVSACHMNGMDIQNKHPYLDKCNPQGNITQQLYNAYDQASNEARMNCQLIVCVLPSQSHTYGHIKNICDTSVGVVTQCLLLNHVRAAKKAYCLNVSLKMNMKLGGTNFILEKDEINIVEDTPTIVIGADLSHPGVGEKSKPSIAALVGSLDKRVAKYSSAFRVQSSNNDVILDLKSMVMELLRAFYAYCNHIPQRIIFYRDGVSEGQFSHIYEQEIERVYEACNQIERGYCPKLTYIVVQKRHRARFFPIEERDADRSGNCLPGTVVDSGITHPYMFDFYIQSHSGIQGTSRSCHYHVLRDDSNFTADQIYTLSYKLCYLFSRATRSVSLVPPVYYAHLLSNRAKYHFRTRYSSEREEEEHDIVLNTLKSEVAQHMYFI